MKTTIPKAIADEWPNADENDDERRGTNTAEEREANDDEGEARRQCSTATEQGTRPIDEPSHSSKHEQPSGQKDGQDTNKNRKEAK